ncbi:LTA synthase family protein [Daejeonella sp.]|jgi:phosphoglycerol transferase MdoB-like AlkP superfamily enzyme|uniref:LTA synthase family protein n=1 Tax=Daejeonella sp. TaxID=2805397 RepID=UPI0037C050C4
MLKSFFVFIRFYLFWLLFFFLDRLLFLIYFSDRISHIGLGEIGSTFLYALRLDSSMIAYISVIPILFYLILLFLPRYKFPVNIGKYYVLFFVLIFSIITIFNLNLYREWGSKINYRALDLAFNSTKEAVASSSSSPILLSLSILIGFILAAAFLAQKLLDFKIKDHIEPIWKKASIAFTMLALLFLAIRGGWQLSPINQSMAYFSNETVLNHAAVNTEWNLIHDILSNKYGKDNPYKYYSRKEAQKILSEIYKKPTEDTPILLNSKQPNVVLIILESYTAELVGILGGEKGVTPNTDRLAREGILFEEIYAAAGRTDKGVLASISAFPAQAIRSVMKQSNKQEKLPGIAQEFEKQSYSTSFYYGGESEFFNMKSYVLSHGYKKLVDQHSFQRKDMNSKWGAYDDKVFTKQLADMDNSKQPFFSTILTLTNHEPFEIPVERKYKGENVNDQFRSTMFYTDSCLGAYLTDAKKKAWYKNTLFVIIADHGHRLPNDLPEFEARKYRIPLIFYGDVIKPEFKGLKISKTGSQTDLVATLLNQVKIDASRYTWSKDLLNPSTPGFAFFNWDNGFGFATKEQVISYDNVGKNIILHKNKANLKLDNQLLRYGQAHMQEVFQQYLDL